jgi:E3 ubiquitin-protein ligase UBR1
MGSSHGGKGKKRSRVYEVVKFDVADGWVSFYHSLYWLLAELYKSTHLLSDEQFESEFGKAQFGVYKSLRDVVSGPGEGGSGDS